MVQRATRGPRFTGGDHLTPKDGLSYYVHQAMMENELNGGYGAYKMSNAVNGSSGPSFGPIQYDIGGNQNGRVVLEKIMLQAKDQNGKNFVSDEEIKQIQKHLYKPFKAMSQEEKNMYAVLKPKMDKALSSEVGIRIINEDYLKILDKKVNDVSKVISQIGNSENKKFLQSSMQAQVFIADIGNQYGLTVNNKLKQFLNQTEKDNGVTLPGNKTVKVHGQLDMEDLKNFRMSTVYGIKHPADAKRRDENIERITAPTRQQEHSKSSEGNDRPADKLQALIQGFKNDKDGTFTAKALADNAEVMANFRDELRESLKQNQAQEVAQKTPQVQEERSYSGRSFV